MPVVAEAVHIRAGSQLDDKCRGIAAHRYQHIIQMRPPVTDSEKQIARHRSA
jgi:hypothetical protein